MDIKQILSDCGIEPETEILAKLENAFRSELARVVKTESEKNSRKFNSLVESLNKKVEAKISNAIAENVGKMKSDAINSRMYSTLEKMANLIESVGIPCTELSKTLTVKLADADRKLQEDYAAREKLKKELNQEYKMNLVNALTAGCHPDVIQYARDYFKNKDIREINKDTVSKVISGDIEPSYPHDVDPEASAESELNMDKIDAALNEMGDAFDREVPGYDSYSNIDDMQPAKTESVAKPRQYKKIGNGLSVERVRVPKGIMEATSPEMDAEVSDVMKQMAAFSELGLGGKFA